MLYLAEIKRQRYTATPITTARASGLYLNNSDLILGLPSLNGQDIHRAADVHFEGRPRITWIRITVHHELTGTSISTDIPTLNEAQKEHEAFANDPAEWRNGIVSWLGNLVHGV